MTLPVLILACAMFMLGGCLVHIYHELKPGGKKSDATGFLFAVAATGVGYSATELTGLSPVTGVLTTLIVALALLGITSRLSPR